MYARNGWRIDTWYIGRLLAAPVPAYYCYRPDGVFIASVGGGLESAKALCDERQRSMT